MQRLRYTVTIDASRERVWKTMLEPATYRQWTKAFSPDSQFRGEWIEGSHIVFFDPSLGGTKALLVEVRPCERVLARHVAIIGQDGAEDTESEMARKWFGVTEQYEFTEAGGVTELVVTVETHEDFAGMFSDGWSKALALLKALCEENG